MKRFLFLLLSISILPVIAQEETSAVKDTSYWKTGGVATATFSQVSLTNWAAGGQNSISINGYFNVFANYAKGKLNWGNNLEMGYGLIQQGKGNTLQKTDDILILTTQFGYKIKGDKLLWSTLLDFRTQFYEGVDADGNKISEFMAPGYLVVATGLDWRPSSVFSLTYAPVTGKFTFVLDQELADKGAFGVDASTVDPNNPAIVLTSGSNTRAELGSFLRASLIKENLVPNISLTSKLELFSNYLVNFGEVDVNWQNLVVMKVNNLITVNWQTQLIYDKDIEFEITDDTGTVIDVEDRVQFKSVFGVGITYKFGQK